MFIDPKQDLDNLETALKAANVAWWVIELPSGVVFFSSNKAEMLGRPAKDFVHYTNFTDLLHKDDSPKAMQAMRDHLEGKTDVYETEYRIQCKDGSYRTFYDKGKIVQRHGKEMKVAGIVIDISDNSKSPSK